MRSRTSLAVIGAALCVVVAGCTTTSVGQPQSRPAGMSETTTMNPSQTASPPPTTGSGAELPSDGAPKVKDPLDTGRYQQNPCQMLTAAQLQELNLPVQGEPGKGPLGLQCRWFNQETGGSVGLQWGDKDPRGLSGVYRAHKAGRYVYFVEFPDIEGSPAVASDLSDNRDTGRGVVTVGVSDQLTFQVSVQLSLQNIGRMDPVETVVRVAGMMVRTMKAGG